MSRPSTRSIVPLIMFGLTILACSGWLVYDKQSADLNSFLLEKPYAWLGVEQSWADPQVDPKIKHPRPDQWVFSLNVPAGYSEIHVIPEHKEMCTYTGPGAYTCIPFQPE